MDLVEVAPQSNPPVCRILDFAKFKYEQEKKEREEKKRHKHAQLKEIRISPRIGTHDYGIKVKHIHEFLKKGYKVKIRMFFRGREFYHQDPGKRIMGKLLEDVVLIGKIEKDPKMMGRSIIVVLGPK